MMLYFCICVWAGRLHATLTQERYHIRPSNTTVFIKYLYFYKNLFFVFLTTFINNICIVSRVRLLLMPCVVPFL